MRFAVTFLGLDLLTIDVDTNPIVCDHQELETDEPGDCTSYPVGFVATHELPDESGIPYREGWD